MGLKISGKEAEDEAEDETESRLALSAVVGTVVQEAEERESRREKNSNPVARRATEKTKQRSVWQRRGATGEKWSLFQIHGAPGQNSTVDDREQSTVGREEG
jgi:hypothetical protein